jgi:hypothetical protein
MPASDSKVGLAGFAGFAADHDQAIWRQSIRAIACVCQAVEHRVVWACNKAGRCTRVLPLNGATQQNEYSKD